MAGIHQTQNWPNHTTLRGIDLTIFHELAERESVGRMIFNVRDSTQYQEDTLTVGGIGVMPVKAEGESLTYVSNNEGFRQTFTHVDYGYGMRVTRNMLRDDLYGSMEELGVELARSWNATEETLLASHFNNGFDSSAATGPDGIELFATNHIREDGTTYRNELSTAADLSQTSLEQALIDFADFRDGGGKRVQVRPRYLIVPNDLRFKAFKLLQSSRTPEDDTNAQNPLVSSESGLQSVPWLYLTDTDAWFLTAAKEDHYLLLYEREAFWTDYEYDFDTKDYKISGMAAQSSAWADPRGVFGSPGA